MSFKDQLKNEILPKTVDYYNSGMDINASIVKAAQDFKLNLDQTDRLLETMNTARVIAHYEKNAEDRTANCDIADKDVVRKMLYADTPSEKKASVQTGAVWGDYSSYMSKERDYRSSAKMSKVASESSEPEKPKSEFTIKQAADHVMDYARKVEMQRQFAEERVAMAESLIATNLSKIASFLYTGYEPERKYALFKAACVKSCPEVVKSVYSEMPKHIVKDAAPHFRMINRANVVDTSEVDDVVKFAEDIEDDIRVLASMKDDARSCLEHEREIKGTIRKYAAAVKTAAPGSPGNPSSGGSGSNNGKKDKKDDKKKDDPWFGKAVKSVYSGIPEATSGQKAIYDYITGATVTPEKLDEAVFGDRKKGTSLKDYVNNMRRSDILSELYSDDPIISEASPEEVTRAYQTLVQASPEASLNKEIVRAVLRQSLNSVAVSPFDAKQWADLDTTLLKNKSITGMKA